eukprot:217053_1
MKRFVKRTSGVTYIERQVIDDTLVIRLPVQTNAEQVLAVDYIRYHIEKEIEESDGSSMFGDVSVDVEGEMEAMETTENDPDQSDDANNITRTKYILLILIIIIICVLGCLVIMVCFFCIREIIKRRRGKSGIELAKMRSNSINTGAVDTTNKICSVCGQSEGEMMVSVSDGSLHCVNCLRKVRVQLESQVDDGDDQSDTESTSHDSMYDNTSGNPCVTNKGETKGN